MKRLLLLLALPFAAEAATPLLDANTLPLVPRYELSAGPVQKALHSVHDKTGQPMQFAVGVPTDLRLTEGRWDDVDADTARWRLRVQSPGALSLNLQLVDMQLPPSAKLWLYDIAGRTTQGPYTQKDISRGGRLWTALAAGEDAILEVRTAKIDQNQVSLHVAAVNHGFKDIANTGAKSGSCNIDVACTEASSWGDETRAVARITIGGRFLCTGQLINNVRQDLTPYFITANHCMVGASDATSAESVVFYWNYQTSQCNGMPDGSLAQNQSGSSLIAGDSRADFTLLQLNQTPLPAFGVYYAGWNIGQAAPQSGITLHHPNGDEKRISIYGSPAAATDVTVDGVLVSAWQVQWNRGVTEPGSSGGGLWDQGHYLIGVLSGGESSCSNPSGNDYFGRLNAGWTANAQPSGQLKAHLDPDNSGHMLQVGRDPTRPVMTSPMSAESGSGVLLGGGGFGIEELMLLWMLAGLRRMRRRHRFSARRASSA